MLLAGIWVLGLIAIVAVLLFDRRVDDARQAQVVIAQMRNQQSALIAIAFAPATSAATSGARGRARTQLQLSAQERVLTGSIAHLTRLGHNPEAVTTAMQRFIGLVGHLSTLVAAGGSQPAALEWGTAQQPGGVYARLVSALDQADATYGADATHSKSVAAIGTCVAILFLLAAFSVAFQLSLRARRRSHRDATTDALTGLGNRRKLFGDTDRALATLAGDRTMTVGILDLDGFKAYNDTFGHPAGDALLARLGGRLAAAVSKRGNAYRIGGDEFVVTMTDDEHDQLLDAAQTALSEKGEGFSIGCSLGSTRMHAHTTLDDALHVADQRLYTNKRATKGRPQSEAREALLQVLAEHDETLVTHLAHVAALAENTAVQLGLPPAEVQLARLAAELHDVGKAAIPDEILNKAGGLDAAEREFMERHSAIGERIVAAAPTLAGIAPIVRAAHERVDGNGYPDGLKLHEIPICSRIIAVVDAYDAMTSDRAYRSHLTHEQAIAELRRCAGSQFDPAVTDAFVCVCQPASVAA